MHHACCVFPFALAGFFLLDLFEDYHKTEVKMFYGHLMTCLKWTLSICFRQTQDLSQNGKISSL